MEELTPLERGAAQHKAGRLAEAEQLYRQVGRRDRHYGESLRLRGLIARQQGDAGKAIKLIRRAVEQQPSSAVFHHTLAEALRSDSQWDQAIISYRRAWKLMPERDATGADLATTQARAGYIDAAAVTWRQLLQHSSQPARIRTRLAQLYYRHGYLQLAQQVLDEWRADADDSVQNWRDLGRAYLTIRQPAAAAECYRAALNQSPDHAESCAGLGNALQLQGESDEAGVWLQKAISLKPELGWVYPALAGIRSHEWTPQSLETLEKQAADTSVPEGQRMFMQFALGAVCDRHQQYEQAFRHYDAGNRIHARAQPFDAAIFESRVERIIKQFNHQFYQQRQDHGVASEKPLFIVGMPRSGTSLVEQIIASHPQAHGAGELETMAALARELPAISGSKKRFPEAAGALDATQTQALAERYLGVLDYHDSDATRVTDKMPMNLLHLGLIALLFPQARVIYCRRDAMDNCLSCFFQIFHESLFFSYNQQHLGQVYRQHERLMAHWQAVLPLDMLTVDYENMVENQEAEDRKSVV